MSHDCRKQTVMCNHMETEDLSHVKVRDCRHGKGCGVYMDLGASELFRSRFRSKDVTRR